VQTIVTGSITEGHSVNMDLIRQDWEALAGKRMQFTHAFYENLFEQYPQYRALFPEALDSQMERMVEMFSSIVRFADHVDLIRPYLVNVGYSHRSMGIGADDVSNFIKVFVDSLAEFRAPTWNDEHAAAWNEAFEDMIVPLFDEGLETGDKLPES
jgi:hemoglobin-like flavoprotein